MSFYKTFTNIDWYYDLKGQGQPLVFIHGWGVNHRIWRQQLKYFSLFYRTLAVDLPGHGRTRYPDAETLQSSGKKRKALRSGFRPAEFQKERECGLRSGRLHHTVTFEDMVYGLIDIINALELAPVTLIGSSLGGLVAFKIYDVCPQIVRSMVFVGSHPKFAREEGYPAGLDVARIRKLADQLELHYPNMLNIFFRSLFTSRERSTRRFKWIQTFRKTDDIPDKKALLDMLDILEKQDLRHVLKNIRVPVQFVNGTQDYICPKALFDAIKMHLPSARFDWFEHCGHFPFLSKPHEFNVVLRDFFTTQGLPQEK